MLPLFEKNSTSHLDSESQEAPASFIHCGKSTPELLKYTADRDQTSENSAGKYENKHLLNKQMAYCCQNYTNTKPSTKFSRHLG
jgi:hypothetical protein